MSGALYVGAADAVDPAEAVPGETVQVTVVLGKPVALNAGQTFAIREGCPGHRHRARHDPMLETKNVVIAVFGATTAASALVLVFVGIIVQTLWTGGLSNVERHAFKVSSYVSAAAFLMGIVCTGLGVWWLTLQQPGKVYIALIAAFLAQTLLIGIAGALVLCETITKRFP